MLTIEQIYLNDSEAAYIYYPEGNKETFGEVKINLADGNTTIEKIASNDMTHRYAGHALHRLRSYYNENHFLATDLVAWG